MAASVCSTPVNTISREALTVLITNNIMNTSVEFSSDCETMETDSPVRKPKLQPISKKLFHSPLLPSQSNENYLYSKRADEKTRKARKRKQTLLPESGEKIKRAYVTECERDGYSPGREGIRKKVLISLFHNKEYSMEMDFGS